MSDVPAPLPASLRPVHALRALRRHGPVVALESARTGTPQGRRSLVAGAPRMVVWHQGGQWRGAAVDGGPGRPRFTGLSSEPFAGLRALLDRHAAEDGAGAAPWGAYGYFGYESTAPQEVPRAPVPDAWFLFPGVVFEWDPADGTGRCRTLGAEPAARWTAALEAELAQDRALPPPLPPPGSSPAPGDLTRDQFRPVFQAIREELRRGNSYQVCFTHPLERPFHGDPVDLYRVLCRDNPAPFAACLVAAGFALVSSSPERFLRVDASGRVEARPMKGTAPRGRTPAEDEARRAALAASTKDRAENLMIADLLRNDLARVCRLGSVRVPAPAAVEPYATVFQMISQVVGRLEPGRGTADLLEASFPPGSMTGAPKQRSVEILRRLESGPRGPYSGILGWWSVTDEADFSVLIRHWLLRDGVARTQVGGGVVWRSREEDEYRESRLKAAALLAALACADRCGDPRRVTA